MIVVVVVVVVADAAADLDDVAVVAGFVVGSLIWRARVGQIVAYCLMTMIDLFGPNVSLAAETRRQLQLQQSIAYLSQTGCQDPVVSPLLADVFPLRPLAIVCLWRDDFETRFSLGSL